MMRPTASALAAGLAVSALVLTARAQDLLAGDAAHGEAVFKQSCALCHPSGLPGTPPSGPGPVLAGVVGRPAATVPNFTYTPALKRSGITWTAENLDRFITNPQAMVHGTAMIVQVPSAKDRRDLITFLGTLRPLNSSAAHLDVPEGRPSWGDWTNDAPGVVHHMTLDQLEKPYASPSSGNNPRTVAKPEGAHLSVPAGFSIEPYVTGLEGPRLLRTAPNGDVFIAENREGRVRVIRGEAGAGRPSQNSVFASGLRGPFGIAFYPLGPSPEWVYVANLNSVVRFPYRNGDLTARGPAETVVPHLAESTGGHVTRDVVFSPDGKRMLISVGSGSNVAEEMEAKSPAEIKAWEADHLVGSAWGWEANRADVLYTDPEGHAPLKVFASGIRNAVGLAIQPGTGDLWVSVNERDGLGDNLVPDYISHIREGGFYGWPWYYLGDHEDPRHAGERPDLAGKAIVPDVLLQAHSASLELAFYTATSGPAVFPADYRGDIFACEHGSWNRSIRTGTKVIRVLMRDGKPTGEYQDFVTGFTVDNKSVWGRPVGVCVAPDGALLISDDGSGTIFRIAYAGK
ncbi:MAG TPA: PQQ-dependent sugar dehydrogenase [Opitutaceae bacterium]|nr:PQQ-dependent sugar dehydrogenase [Opitutaceae bacterium]